MLAVIIFGLFGQIAWTLENMYFNVFLYETVTYDPNAVALMVALSAITATITAIIVGAFSDKIAKRKIIITICYIAWGLSIMVFALISKDNVAKSFPNADIIKLTASFVILMDCVMTFFGSAAFDSTFNAWITDVTTTHNRAKFEGVASALSLLSVLIVFAGLDGLAQSDNWIAFYLIAGGLVTACGLAGIFILKDKPNLKPAKENYFRNLIVGFKLSSIKSHPQLYLTLIAVAIYSLSQQIYMPYLLIYLKYYLGLTDYAILLGVLLVLTAVASIICGKIADKHGKGLIMLISASLVVIGAMGAFLQGEFNKENIILFAILGFLMLSGGMIVSLLLNAIMRDYIPETKYGHYAGIRMVAMVLIPMCVGPGIGAAIIKEGAEFVNDYGAVENIPQPVLFLYTALASLLMFIPLIFILKGIKPKKTKPVLLTRWGKELLENPSDVPLPEYPRPQFKRESYLNINGKWQYRISALDGTPRAEGDIIVPFSPESPLSGVNKELQRNEKLYYNRKFTLDAEFVKDVTVLHFGAVDQSCEVFINGISVGKHVGGYLPFSLDISKYINIGENEISLEVVDVTDKSYYSHGKQASRPINIWYSPQSGIWQTVWLESLPKIHLKNVKFDPDIDNNTISITPMAECEDIQIVATIYFDGREITHANLKPNVKNVIEIPDAMLWTPETPNLYDVVFKTGDDVVESYFGMRKFSIVKDDNNIIRLTLNNKPYFHNGLLDQGYWSDGYLTPPSDAAMLSDIKKMKELGFNTLRKHIKIEPLRWYYYCDHVGMLVWQDMVNGGGYESFIIRAIRPFIGWNLEDGKTNYRKLGRGDPAGRENYYYETDRTVDLLYNSVSIATWVPFNESWGQFDALKAVQFIRERDKSRYIDHASGWYDQGGGDFNSVHIYFRPVKVNNDGKRATVLSEFGGYSHKVTGHVWNENHIFGYKTCKTQDEFTKAYEALYREQIIPAAKSGLCASIYTQVTDVEDEINGLLTYDRYICKADTQSTQAINKELFDLYSQL
jgi:MFS family permease